MGLEIKQNSKGLFKLTSTVSDESHHPDKKWISLDEAKEILIYTELRKFIENGSRNMKDESKSTHLRWLLDNAYGEGGVEKLEAKFKEVIKRLEIDLDFSDEQK